MIWVSGLLLVALIRYLQRLAGSARLRRGLNAVSRSRGYTQVEAGDETEKLHGGAAPLSKLQALASYIRCRALRSPDALNINLGQRTSQALAAALLT